MRRVIRSSQASTLVEVLAATVIMGVLSYALTESLISGLVNTKASQERTAGSIGRQRVAAAFVPDVQSARPFDQAPAVTPYCGNPEPDELVRLRSTDDQSLKVVSYFVRTAESKRQLIRRSCEDGSVKSEQELAEFEGSAASDCPAVSRRCRLIVTDGAGEADFTVSAVRRTP